MTTSKFKISNKVMSVLLCVALLLSYVPFSSLTASAATTTGSCGTNATYTLDDSGVLTIRGTGAINASAFAYKTTITSVVIEPGITSIGAKAFFFCSKMTSVKIPSTVESIGNQAFQGCKIKTLYIPSSVKTIGNMAFYDCGNGGMYVTIEANSALAFGSNVFKSSAYNAKFYVNYLGTTAPTLIASSTFPKNATVNLPATYNNGTVTAFANATVKMFTQADAVASVTFPNNMVIYYDSLQSAFQGASGTTSTKITLLKDIEDMSTSSALYGTADVIFDMNGKNITINGSYYIAAHTGAKLTMTGTGKITYNYNATGVPNGSGYALYAPIKVYTSQNDVGVAELVIGGNVTVEATDDLTAAVSVGANAETAPAKLTVEDNAKLISNNASYIISYNSPVSATRWGKCEIILEGGTFENKKGGSVVGYDDTPYDNPDELYHTYIAIDGIKLDSKLKNVYYKLTNAIPATLTYSANAVTRGANTYGLAGSMVAFTAAAQSGYTIKKILANDTETTLTEGVYSFTMPSKLVTLTSEGEGTPLYDVTVNTATGGTVSPDKTSAAKDDTVTLTVASADGYKLDTLTVDGTNVTDSVADGKYTFTMPGKNITVAATFKIDHTHAWEYTVSDKTITAKCKNTDGNCPNTNGGSVTLKVSDAYYTGDPVSATTEGSFTNGATYKITYNDGSETAPSTIDTHTAKLTVSENGTEKQSVTAEYTISYLPTPSPAYGIDNGYNDGNTYWFADNATIKIDAPADYKISTALNGAYGDSVTLSESDSKVIYLKNDKGEMTDAIPISETLSFDKTAPTGKVEIKDRGFWETLLNKITFGLFFKGDKVVTVTTADTDGSGVKSIEYYLADKDLIDGGDASALETALGDKWSTYDEEIPLDKNAKYIIYVKITDNVGNVAYINSEGIVLYTDAEAKTTEISYTYKENSDKDVEVTLNGNSVKSVACGTTLLVLNTDYTVTGGTITLKAAFLDRLNVGEYTFTVSYNPLGFEYVDAEDNEAPATTTFTVKVVQADGAVSNISNIGKTYDGTAISAPTFDKLGTGNATIEYKVKGADDSTYKTTAPSAAGDYVVRVTVEADTNYKKASGTAEFTIGKAKLTGVSVEQDGKLTYNKDALTAKVKTDATAVNNQTVTFTYSTGFEHDKSFTATVPAFTSAGEHIVYYKASAPNHEDYTDSFTVTIDRQTVTEPTIASKAYNGSAQTANITETDLYTVETNNGGTAKGSYDVVLKLKDAVNYKWSTTDDATVTLPFIITATANSWTTTPAISGWTYGQAANKPSYAAKFGTVKVNYTGTANDGTAWDSETAPTKAGNYTATFTVDATDDYGSLNTSVDFVIARAKVTVTANDAGKTYGDSDPTLTYSHTDLVGQDTLTDISVSRASGENATTYTITADQKADANPNYEITFKTGTFTINKATLTVTAEEKTATYGDKAPAYTVTYSGFKNGDDKEDLDGTLAFDCNYAQFADKGDYTITPKGYESGNYNFKYVDGKLTVNAKPIIVTVEAKSSIYGNEIVALTATDNGVVNNDADVYKLTTTASETADVGKYDITGEALDDNYIITFANEDDAYEITARELTVTVAVADKKYDGLNTATITSAILNNVVDADKDKVMLVNGTPTFVTVNVAEGISIAFTDFTLSGEANVLKNYTLTQPTGVKANITNDWTPTEYTVSAPNANGWLNADFVVTANDGYELSLANTADGTWSDKLTGAVEGADSNMTFFVRNKTDGTISLAKTETYKLDKNTETTNTTGKVYFDERNGWESFLNTISFGLFYNAEVTVKVDATDALSDIASIEYASSDKALILDEVKAITEWTAMPENGVAVTVEDAKQFVYFIRITDKAGNVTYLSTDGAEYDTTAPVITGVENGKTYYTTQKATITDKNINSITLNGEDATGTITLDGNKDATYTIVVTDKAGNTTTVTVTMKPVVTVGTPIDDITEDEVKSTDKDTVQDVIDQVDELLSDDNLTDEEKSALEEIKGEAEKLIEKIEEVTEATDTKNTEKVQDVTSENVTPEDKTDLGNAKADLEKALEDNGDNYTEDEKKAIQDEIDRIDEALAIVENVEAVEDEISNLPDTVTKDDSEAIKAAEDAYNALTDYEKSLVDKDTKAKLEKAVADLAELNKPADTTSPETGDSSNLWMWFAVAFISGSCLLGTVIYKKKQEAEEN